MYDTKNFRFVLPTGRLRCLIEDTKSTILFRIFYEKLGDEYKCRFTKIIILLVVMGESA